MKAGLVDLADDDRATLYGAFLTLALCKRAFEAVAEMKAKPPTSRR